jgi:hypothetical protein
MKTFYRPTLIAALATLSLSGASVASEQREPHYFGPISADEEKNTFGYSADSTSAPVQLVLGPLRYFGPVTGTAEKDTFAHVVSPSVRTTFVSAE